MTVRKDTKQHFKQKLWNNTTTSQQNIDTWPLKPSRFHLWISPQWWLCQKTRPLAPSRFRFFANFQAQPQLAIITNTLGSLIVAPCLKSLESDGKGKSTPEKPMVFLMKNFTGGFRWPFSHQSIDLTRPNGMTLREFFYRIEPQWKDDEVYDQWLMMVNSV